MEPARRLLLSCRLWEIDLGAPFDHVGPRRHEETPVSAVVAGRDAKRGVQTDRTRWDRTTLRQRKSRGQVRSHVVEMDNQRVAVRCLESGYRGRIAAAMRVRVITCDHRVGCRLREPSITLK